MYTLNKKTIPASIRMAVQRTAETQRDKSSSMAVTFAPQINFEGIVMQSVLNIIMAPARIAESGDATRSHAIVREEIQLLDDFVFPIITSNDRYSKSGYADERKKIIDEWAKASEPKRESECAHRLFRLTIETLSHYRLFKVRQYYYFTIGQRDDVTTGKSVIDLQKEEDEFADDSATI